MRSVTSRRSASGSKEVDVTVTSVTHPVSFCCLVSSSSPIGFKFPKCTFDICRHWNAMHCDVIEIPVCCLCSGFYGCGSRIQSLGDSCFIANSHNRPVVGGGVVGKEKTHAWSMLLIDVNRSSFSLVEDHLANEIVGVPRTD